MLKFIPKSVFSIFLLTSVFVKVVAQNNGPILAQQPKIDSIGNMDVELNNLKFQSLIVPTAFIGYGIASLSVKGIKQLNFSTRDEINEHRPDHIKLDNYTQFAPAALVYGLNALGMKGKHNLRDRSTIYGTSMLITSALVIPLKHMVRGKT
jgi:hypothetical protein